MRSDPPNSAAGRRSLWPVILIVAILAGGSGLLLLQAGRKSRPFKLLL